MDFNAAEVKRLAYLEKIKLTDKEAELIAEDLSNTVAGLSEFLNADTKGAEPLFTVMDEPIYLRPDTVADGGIAEIIVALASEKEETFFTVPKVLD